MNFSRLALGANPGGALHPRPVFLTKHNCGPLTRLVGGSFASLLKLIGLTACLATISPAATVPDVTVAWNANTETNITGYKLKYGTSPGVYPNVMSVGTTPSTTVTGLNEATTY
ncbi:MAG: hypothetical protein EOP85_03385, partial [Verrucomicrobiaceae bacterium]